MTTQIPTRHPELADVCVADAMHPGVLTCPSETPLRDVARMLVSYAVHCIVVLGSEEEHEDGEERPWAVVSDLDLVAAALAGGLDEHTAGGVAGSPVVLISGRETLGQAAHMMSEYQTSHLLVVEPDELRPVGIVSTLDVAAALAELPVRSGPPRVERR
jgi:CBS domain-containing protein